MSSAPAPSPETPPVTTAPAEPSFMQENMTHILLLVAGVASIVIPPLWAVLGLVRGLTAYRGLVTGGKSFSRLRAEAEYSRKSRIARDGGINLMDAAGGDGLTAMRNKGVSMGIRLVLVILFYPLIEIYFQARYLMAARKAGQAA